MFSYHALHFTPNVHRHSMQLNIVKWNFINLIRFIHFVARWTHSQYWIVQLSHGFYRSFSEKPLRCNVIKLNLWHCGDLMHNLVGLFVFSSPSFLHNSLKNFSSLFLLRQPLEGGSYFAANNFSSFLARCSSFKKGKLEDKEIETLFEKVELNIN